MILKNLLEEGLKDGIIEKTKLTRKLNVGGSVNTYPVYKIRLDALYYNDKNDRIATWISKYKAENSNKDFNIDTDRENYNNLIQDFIIKSNPDSIRKTKRNIEAVEQQESGVVLNDGRIIDGNRRYTCLRLLHAENIHKHNYFEAVILDRDFENNEKQIKMLELAIQHGEDSKIDYNPIDRLVGIYNDIIENKLLTIKEYAQITNESENDIKKKVELAELMVEYLEFIQEPKQFYIAREQEIDGPLHEIITALKKCSSEDKKFEIKQVLFNMLLNKPDSDMTRYIRDIKNDVINTEHEDVFIEEQMEVVQETMETLIEAKNNAIDTSEIISNIRKDEKIKEKINNSKTKAVDKTKLEKVKNLPLDRISKSLEFLEEINDYYIFSTLSSSQKEDILKQLQNLQNKIEDIRNHIGE